MTARAPIRKLNVGIGAGSVFAVLVGLVARRLGLDLTPEEAIALGTLLGTLVVYVAGYLTPDPRVAGSSHADAPDPT